MRKSFIVSAKRIWLTRPARCNDASSENLPACLNPSTTTIATKATPIIESGVPASGHMPMSPTRVSGEVLVATARSTADHPTRSTPTMVAIVGDTGRAEATSAEPNINTPARAPTAPNPRTYSAVLPGSDADTANPRPAAPVEPHVTAVRSCFSAARRATKARSTGACKTYWTVAASNTSGPPWMPDRIPRYAARATIIPRAAGARATTSATSAALISS
ncbi:hypothetical protein BMS3Bbin02_01571 [bacterium BMS3Bbin02]|nr:hypothetical protein BMS3Bbin02_01571 [bacterium BMS3Bbin02]